MLNRILIILVFACGQLFAQQHLYSVDADRQSLSSLEVNYQSSDYRYKTNVEPIGGVLKKISRLYGVYYNWNTEAYPQKKFSKEKQVGFIAQEIEAEFPEVVTSDSEGYLMVDYAKFTPILLQAIKEQQKEIEALEKKITDLEKKINGNNGYRGQDNNYQDSNER